MVKTSVTPPSPPVCLSLKPHTCHGGMKRQGTEGLHGDKERMSRGRFGRVVTRHFITAALRMPSVTRVDNCFHRDQRGNNVFK